VVDADTDPAFVGGNVADAVGGRPCPCRG
jgi:hypothetical protein